MATKTLRGDAVDVKQVNTVTVGGTAAVGQVYTVTINGKTVTYTAIGGDTNNTIASSLQTNLAASTIAEFDEITWTVATNVVTGTADTAGKPFVNTSSATGTGTLVTATTTASSGKNHWDTAANWDPSGVPVSGDDVRIANSAVDLLYGLDQNAVALTTLWIDQSYEGNLGLPRKNSGGYYEYRSTYLQIRPGTLIVGQGAGNGSGRIKIDAGSAAVFTAIIYATGAAAEVGLESLLLKGVFATNAINVLGGSVGIAVLPGEVSTVQNLRVGQQAGGSTAVRCGSGLTLTTLDHTAGTIETNAAITTVNQSGGTHDHRDGAITTVNGDGGTLYVWPPTATGTITTLRVGNGFTVDFSRDLRAKTVSACDLHAGGTIRDPHRTVTWTAGIDLERCGLPDVVIDVGQHVKLTPGTPS